MSDMTAAELNRLIAENVMGCKCRPARQFSTKKSDAVIMLLSDGRPKTFDPAHSIADAVEAMEATIAKRGGFVEIRSRSNGDYSVALRTTEPAAYAAPESKPLAMAITLALAQAVGGYA